MHAPAKCTYRPGGNSAGRALNPRHPADNPRTISGRFHRVPASGSTPAPGVADRALAVSRSRRTFSQTVGDCPCARVFCVGAENCARGGRAPVQRPPSGCFRRQGIVFGACGNFRNGSGNFLKVPGNCRKVSGNFPKGSANCPRVSANCRNGRGNFLKGSANFPKASGNFPKGSDNCPNGSANCRRVRGNFLRGSANFPDGSAKDGSFNQSWRKVDRVGLTCGSATPAAQPRRPTNLNRQCHFYSQKIHHSAKT